ncbi:Scytalone dehydratase-like protein Arp1 like [Verticillium longisporum]|uniref:Scytalone dehydratase-like protein Arp1 like n=2 Tax=Verticillium longisporum TaxID=100787 RepID=A0A8I3AGA4_VERLO|nr:Scytalone dehydratase-like protein Arp1 like [Verticillium longisporum]
MRSFALLSLGFIASAAAQFVQTGASVKLNDVYYYVSPYSQGKAYDGPFNVKSLPRAFGFTPITVVADELEKESLEGLFGNWTTKDDVWQPAFLSAIFLAGQKTPCLTKASYHEDVSSIVVPLNKDAKLPSGPYFLDTSSGEVCQAFRLYADFAGAFTESLIQAPKGDLFQPLSAQIPASASLTIGVPSRLYFTKTAEKPLAGVRIGVKDIYDLAGVKKSNGNRAWYGLYPAASKTATAIQNLIDAGGIVVGYQKTSQFANGESPTADWVDFHAPFNPRGDGYNNPSSSSAGAGASVASYQWLDIAVGSDTGGSIRGPAGVQGLFGNRPSHGLVSLANVMPLSPTLDTPGFLVRDPEIWDAASKAMYQGNYTSLASGKVKYPTKLLTLGFPASTTPAGRILNDFAAKLASHVGGKLTTLDLNAAWSSSAPAGAKGASLSDLLSATYATLITKEQIALVREPFYADYAAAHGGRRPFVNPVPLSRWGWGDSVPDSWHADALANKTLFMDWFNSEVVPASNDAAQCTESLVLYVGSTGSASPRNRYTSAPGVPLGFSSSRISVFAEVPDLVFPLGEVASLSSITGVEEKLPVAVDIMAAKGCDGVIVKLAKDLVAEGVLTVPKAGATLEGGEVLLRRDEVHGYY